MKHFYNISKLQVLLIACLVSCTLSNAQNIRFTFINAVNTNDGTSDYYEADVMVETIDGQEDFKMGSGQIYFNYNEAAFGPNINANANFEATTVYPEYFLGQNITVPFPFDYYSFDINDNTTSTVSWSFSENIPANSMTELVTSTPRNLVHLKIKYIDVTQSPDVEFNTTIVDSTSQFYTACGGTGSVDCTGFPGTQFVDAIFDNSNAVLSVEDQLISNTQITMYPNPTTQVFYIQGLQEESQITIYDINGKLVLTKKNYQNQEGITIEHLNAGTYLVKIQTKQSNTIKKLIKH